MSQTPTPAQTRTPTVMWPCLRYADAPAAIRFLVDAFGFEETLVVTGEAEGTVAHAELRWPEGGDLMIGSAGAESTINEVTPGVGCVNIVVADPDAVFSRAVAAGATTAIAPRDSDHGSRLCTLRDPEGVYWNFDTYGGAG